MTIHRAPLGDDFQTPCCRVSPLLLGRDDELTIYDSNVSCSRPDSAEDVVEEDSPETPTQDAKSPVLELGEGSVFKMGGVWFKLLRVNWTEMRPGNALPSMWARRLTTTEIADLLRV